MFTSSEAPDGYEQARDVDYDYASLHTPVPSTHHVHPSGEISETVEPSASHESTILYQESSSDGHARDALTTPQQMSSLAGPEISSPVISCASCIQRAAANREPASRDQNAIEDSEISSPLISHPSSLPRNSANHRPALGSNANAPEDSEISSPMISYPSSIQRATPSRAPAHMGNGSTSRTEFSGSSQPPLWAAQIRGKMLTKFGKMQNTLFDVNQNMMSTQDTQSRVEAQVCKISQELTDLRKESAHLRKKNDTLTRELSSLQAQIVRRDTDLAKELAEMKRAFLDGIGMLSTAKTELANSMLHMDATVNASLNFLKVNVLRELGDARIATAGVRGTLEVVAGRTATIQGDVEGLRADFENVRLDRMDSLSDGFSETPTPVHRGHGSVEQDDNTVSDNRSRQSSNDLEASPLPQGQDDQAFAGPSHQPSRTTTDAATRSDGEQGDSDFMDDQDLDDESDPSVNSFHQAQENGDDTIADGGFNGLEDSQLHTAGKRPLQSGSLTGQTRFKRLARMDVEDSKADQHASKRHSGEQRATSRRASRRH